ncbi:MAG TPA: hypothetical protein VEA99_11185 [Gemmatimonadaceae bacterium]|nr:hypothetical protein [Gemmatimonadaceae bacterium]
MATASVLVDDGAQSDPAAASPRDGRRVAPATRALPAGRVAGAISLLLLAGNAVGARYYAQPLAARARSPLHPLLKSSGAVGQGTGLAALLIFVFLWLYPLRKRWRWLAFTGTIGRWMDVHVVAALSLPLLLAMHATWRFGGIIGIGFWAMMVVCASGVVGRYLYVRIPRSRTGVELSLEEVAGQRRALVQQLMDASGLELHQVQALLAADGAVPRAAGPLGALRLMLGHDLRRRRLRRAIRERCARLRGLTPPLDGRALDRVADLAAREIALAHQVALLHATHRIFRWWHVAHRPIALTALAAVLIHVAVVVAMGTTWFW